MSRQVTQSTSDLWHEFTANPNQTIGHLTKGLRERARGGGGGRETDNGGIARVVEGVDESITLKA